jgi:hypothetical protein
MSLMPECHNQFGLLKAFVQRMVAFKYGENPVINYEVPKMKKIQV